MRQTDVSDGKTEGRAEEEKKGAPFRDGSKSPVRRSTPPFHGARREKTKKRNGPGEAMCDGVRRSHGERGRRRRRLYSSDSGGRRGGHLEKKKKKKETWDLFFSEYRTPPDNIS